MMEKGISSIDFRLSLHIDTSQCAHFEVGGTTVFLHGTLDEMRAFLDAVDVAISEAEEREELSLGF